MKKSKLLIISSLLFSTITACGVNQPSTSMVQESQVHSISLFSAPTKKEYNINETLDLTGAVITVVYNNGDPKNINVTLDMIEKVDMSTEGEKTVIIKYENKQTSFTITVIDNRPSCEITFPNNKSEYIYDGQPKTINYQVPEDVECTAEYQQNETFYSSYDNAPKEIGIYALVVKTKGNNEFKPTTNFFVFRIVENKPEVEITFSNEKTFYYEKDVPHSPTFTVENDLPYSVEYRNADTDEFIGYSAPIDVGNYTLCVTVESTETTRETTRYCSFSIIASSESKATPTIVFEFEAGAIFTVGTAPTYKITDTEGNEITDADVIINYSSDTTGYNSSELPTVAGAYGLTITVNENDKYNKVTASRWFRVSSKIDCPIEINLNGDNVFTLGETRTIDITVPAGVYYSVEYQKDEKFYSNFEDGLPKEVGYYAIVVKTVANETYNETSKFVIISIIANEA